MFQLGFVVDDLFEAATHWVRVFGVGPFHIMPRVRSSCRYRGRDASVDIHIGVAQAGPVQIELIRDYTDGPSVFRDLHNLYDFTKSGFHQISTLTRDYDGKKAHYLGTGYELACEFTSPAKGSPSSTPLTTSGFSPKSSRKRAVFGPTYPRFRGRAPTGMAPTPSVSSLATGIARPCPPRIVRRPARDSFRFSRQICSICLLVEATTSKTRGNP